MRLRLLAIVIVGLWWWWPGSSAPPALDLVAATTSNTFAILDRTSSRLTEITLRGAPIREVDVPRLEDARVVGTRYGAALVWKDKKKVAFAPVEDPSQKQVHGKRVERLCAQTATTPRWFSVSWLESDGAIWILRGQIAEATQAVALDEIDAAPLPYCGISDAAQDVVLLYQNGSRYEMVRCPEKTRCSSPRKISLDKNFAILGFGCTSRHCLIGARDRRDQAGRPSLFWIDHKGSKVDSLTLEDGVRDSIVTVVGQGDQFAIGYTNGLDPIALLSTKPGDVTEIWSAGDAGTVPALSWMGNMLLIASQQDGHLVTKTMIR
jgi:hypothetical protein